MPLMIISNSKIHFKQSVKKLKDPPRNSEEMASLCFSSGSRTPGLTFPYALDFQAARTVARSIKNLTIFWGGLRPDLKNDEIDSEIWSELRPIELSAEYWESSYAAECFKYLIHLSSHSLLSRVWSSPINGETAQRSELTANTRGKFKPHDLLLPVLKSWDNASWCFPQCFMHKDSFSSHSSTNWSRQDLCALQRGHAKKASDLLKAGDRKYPTRNRTQVSRLLQSGALTTSKWQLELFQAHEVKVQSRVWSRNLGKH